MRHWIHKHLPAIGYVFLVLMTAAVLEWHHSKTIEARAKLQHETCIRATVLADNQAKVIGTLIALLEIEQDEATEDGVGDHVIGQLDQLRQRLDTIPEFDCE